MLSDKERKDALLASKEEQKLDFEKDIQELFLQQDKAKAEMQQEHTLQKLAKDNEYKEKQRQIEELERTNVEQRKKIEEEAWIKIDELKDKNKEELAKHIDAGMDSKCQLTIISNSFKLKKQEKQNEETKIQEKQKDLKDLFKQTNNLKQRNS